MPPDVAAARAVEPSEATVKSRPSATKERDVQSGDSLEYWVQVAALRDAGLAKQIAAKLRDRDFPVTETTITGTKGLASRPATANDRYEILVAAAPDVAPAVTWYRVRVGPFTDRATAQETLRKLTVRGYAPFIARGQE